jgi:hypothetical protein
MPNKTVRKTPGTRKPSPTKTKGLIANGRKNGQSAQDPCVLDNHSHRTPRGLPDFAKGEPIAVAIGLTAGGGPVAAHRMFLRPQP